MDISYLHATCPLATPKLHIPSKQSGRHYLIPPPLRVFTSHKSFEVRDLSYRPSGTQHNLLNEVSLSLPERSFGLMFGRSGSGKTTLLQLLAGLLPPTSGSIYIQRCGDNGRKLEMDMLSSKDVGIVFQFPERYFVAETVVEELTFGWPRQADSLMQERLKLGLQTAVNLVGMNKASLEDDVQSLSGGHKRRLALAIQLVQMPSLLLLDEPLAGLENFHQLRIGHG